MQRDHPYRFRLMTAGVLIATAIAAPVCAQTKSAPLVAEFLDICIATHALPDGVGAKAKAAGWTQQPPIPNGVAWQHTDAAGVHLLKARHASVASGVVELFTCELSVSGAVTDDPNPLVQKALGVPRTDTTDTTVKYIFAEHGQERLPLVNTDRAAGVAAIRDGTYRSVSVTTKPDAITFLYLVSEIPAN